MERKNRNMLVLLTAVVIAVAVFTAFGRNLFTLNMEPIPPIPAQSAAVAPDGDGKGDTNVAWVEVTPATVQSVIATLARPESYYREVLVEDYLGEGRGYGATTAKVWSDSGWTRVEANLPSGVVRTSIVGDGTLWWWYSGDRRAASQTADSHSGDLEGQRIPTYEDVLELEPSEIVAADYEQREGLSCIVVEVERTAADYTSRERYWISVDSGLLVWAETLDGEIEVFRMSAGQVERPVPSGTAFSLPDGTLLHTVGGLQ